MVRQSDLEIVMKALSAEQQRIEDRGPAYIPDLKMVAHNINQLRVQRDSQERTKSWRNLQ